MTRILCKCNPFISECIPPLSPGNGSVQISLNGETASYSCDVGYTLNGSAERQCSDNGMGWSDSDPICGKLFTVNLFSGGALA